MQAQSVTGTISRDGDIVTSDGPGTDVYGYRWDSYNNSGDFSGDANSGSSRVRAVSFGTPTIARSASASGFDITTQTYALMALGPVAIGAAARRHRVRWAG